MKFELHRYQIMNLIDNAMRKLYGNFTVEYKRNDNINKIDVYLLSQEKKVFAHYSHKLINDTTDLYITSKIDNIIEMVVGDKNFSIRQTLAADWFNSIEEIQKYHLELVWYNDVVFIDTKHLEVFH